MSSTFDQGKDAVARLCQYFATNRQSFLAPGVKEAHVRQSLIDPFFEALGWDVRNGAMTAPQYREVIPEDSLDVEGQQKAPDYTFRVGTLPKFYAEAKKCGVDISADPGPAYQLRRYGFSAKLALSILTDFDELGVYDCAARPRPSDKASHARIQYFGFAEYPDRWREIWDVFSREAVWSGKFDQYAASKRKRGTSEVDSEFLKDIEGWRDVLARNLALRNGHLLVDDLNAAVQRIIDRIVFLRMAEDRGLESYGQLLKLCERPDIYARFMSGLCRKADEKYNSGLFHFQKEPGVSDAPDTLTPRLAVDDKALKPILQSLYFEHGSPYNFGVLPVEILGTVYERFLGKVIRLTAGNRAKVEEKPEVRKAGGVYYTPAYIVNYIVQNTVGKQIEGRTPADLAGGKTAPPFRVLDMACGSGSFLLGAYQLLLEHCLNWYQANPSPKHARSVYQNAKGETCLSIAERKRILTTHIYGVDIDRQAVEVTKLSLLLKALEGENDATLSQQMSLFQERALPNLSQNIKCGNSLIASDFSMIPEDLVRVHAFDWPAQFPEAMKAGGFDAVVGNPPYLGGREWKKENGREYGYFVSTYTVAEYQFDIYALFLERGIELLKQNGRLGFITPNTWLNNQSNARLRKFILDSTSIRTIADYSRTKVFPDAVVLPIVTILEKQKLPNGIVKIVDPDSRGQESCLEIPQRIWAEDELSIFNINLSEQDVLLRRKIERGTQRLDEIASVKFGIKLYETGKGTPPQKPSDATNRIFESEEKVDSRYRRYLEGKDIHRYETIWRTRWLRYGSNLAAPRDPRLFEGQRLLVRRIVGVRLIATLVDDVYVTSQLLQIVKPHDEKLPRYILGLLNSSLLAYHFRIKYNRRDKTFPEIRIYELAAFPIRLLDHSRPSDRAHHDRIVALADKMLALTPKLRAATSESEKAALRNAIATTDAEIDRLVYDLYGLTEEEIKLVEGES
jgi:hypothetical protein